MVKDKPLTVDNLASEEADLRKRLKEISDARSKVQAEENSKLSSLLERVKVMFAKEGIEKGQIVINLDASTISRVGANIKRGPRAQAADLTGCDPSDATIENFDKLDGGAVVLKNGKRASTCRYLALAQGNGVKHKALVALGFSDGQVSGADNALKGRGGRGIPEK